VCVCSIDSTIHSLGEKVMSGLMFQKDQVMAIGNDRTANQDGDTRMSESASNSSNHSSPSASTVKDNGHTKNGAINNGGFQKGTDHKDGGYCKDQA
jgi:hypothetical protein